MAIQGLRMIDHVSFDVRNWLGNEARPLTTAKLAHLSFGCFDWWVGGDAHTAFPNEKQSPVASGVRDDGDFSPRQRDGIIHGANDQCIPVTPANDCAARLD